MRVRSAPSLLLAVLLAAAACSGSAGFDILPQPPLETRKPRTPVVFVPGVTGTALRNVRTGRLLWGTPRTLFLPRDGGRALALPLAEQGDPVRAEGPLLFLRMFMWRREIYRPLRRLMAREGYQEGRLEAPRPGDDFFFFVYDWRRDSLAGVRRLAVELDGLRQARGEATLAVTLVCQSNAGRLCRYFAKYGDLPPAQIEAGVSSTSRVRVGKLILVGTSNGGALRILHELNRGRTYVPLLGRRWLPETLFTLRSLYDDLPTYTGDLFVDEAGGRLDVDLFDVESWERYGWSVFSPEVERRLGRRRRSDLFADRAARRRFLMEQLERSFTLDRLLQSDTPRQRGTAYYLLGARSFETPARAVLRREGAGWGTYFSEDRRVRRDPLLRALATAPGDGHATVSSQTHLSAGERRALVEAPTALGGGHFEVLLEPQTEAKILEYLAD